MGQLHLLLFAAPTTFSESKMIKTVAIVCFLAVAVMAEESIISYNAEDHQHEQTGDAGNAVTGSYSHTDAEGKVYTINYTADENGYRAQGDHLPVAPEVPAVAEAKSIVPAAAYAPLPYSRSAYAAAPFYRSAYAA